MTESKDKLTEIIEQISIQAMIVNYDDIQTFGSILEKLELIQQLIEKDQSAPHNLGIVLKILVEKIILHEIPEGKDGLALLRQGLSLLQEHFHPPHAENLIRKINLFIKEIKSLGLAVDIEVSNGEPKGFLPENEQINLQDLELYKDFISEALDYLNNMELHIINLEQNPEDQEVLNSIFRPFHTIKGVSGFLHQIR